MEELIAKRYVKALQHSSSEADLENFSLLFSTLAAEFSNPKFDQIINSSDVSAAQKETLLLESVKSAQSDTINNFVKLLVENGRINIIPAVAKVLDKEIAKAKKSYSGVVYSNSDIDAGTITGLSAGLGKKVDASITLEFVKSDFDGIKVEVEDLGIEVNFSKSRINMQLIEHILKAI
ncbi:MAG: F0F1 ATP synthase subunit delta [Campylobacterota bacterium]|nr:F0F1 ATP synthase subunit delta [Campylobacterota bacterium]